MPTTLFRPVGLPELALLWDTGMHEFPPRLIQQPIFYPVLNWEYARQIARDWNTRDANSGFAGFVTQFGVSSTHLSKFEIHTAGSALHREYWIPAREMISFNKAISGQISVVEAFFGSKFTGYVAEEHQPQTYKAAEQFTALSNIQDFAEFSKDVSANRKAIFLNCLFWFNSDLSVLGCTSEQRHLFFTRLAKAWTANKIETPLPIRLNSG